ncbi:MAG: elongation factor P maturation arginine rhamnosyltransferase EarP, partial [Candidatus Saccharimonas sp.]|nr:elongation factor P maturation arginine rhamnosyltransferase EarP [Planctomycetaceae bacterium]
IAAMAGRAVVPVWINLEYLSAEAWVDDCHLLPSPHPRWPLTKYFFFPGFTSKTGGLLRERDVPAARAAFDPTAAAEFWRSLGVAPPTDDELRISLFCYDNPALPELLQCWADGPAAVLVLAAPGAATEQIAHWFGETLSPGTPFRRGSLMVQALPFLLQPDYDRLLWACDVNFVRGEDSFVRAQWAERPFVWQIYPQAENAHLVKLDAFLTRYLGEFQDSESDVVRRCWHAWNGTGDMAAAWQSYVANRHSLQRHGKVWANQLDRPGDLANNLARFVLGK